MKKPSRTLGKPLQNLYKPLYNPPKALYPALLPPAPPLPAYRQSIAVETSGPGFLETGGSGSLPEGLENGGFV